MQESFISYTLLNYGNLNDILKKKKEKRKKQK